MGKKNILLIVITILLFNINSVYALEVSEGWTEYESGISAVDIDKLKEFEEKLSTRVNELNKLDLDKVYRYRVEVSNDLELDDYIEVSNDKDFDSYEEADNWATDNKPEFKGYKFIENIVSAFKLDKILDLTRFETIEEAQNTKEDFENSVDNETGDVTINEIRDESGDVTVNVENNYKFDTFDSAYNASLELIDNNHDYIVEVTVVQGEDEFVRTDTLTLDSIFDTREKALEYIASLEESGYEVNYTINEVNEYSTLDDTYETIEEANAALEVFLEAYPETTTYGVEEIRDESGDTTEEIENDYKFYTEEEAQTTAESLEEETKYYVVEVNVIKGEDEFDRTITDSLEIAFTTQEEALEYVTSLENDGYEVEYDIEEVNEYSTLDRVYETSEEANKALEEFLEQYPETTVSSITEFRDESGDKTEKVENNYKFDTFAGAEAAALELRANNNDYIVEVNVYAGSPEFVRTDTLTLNMVFDSNKEALDFISNLEESGYEVDYEINEVTETTTLSETYDTLELANAALEKFKSECDSFISSNIEEVKDTTEDTTNTENGTTEYETRASAEAAAESLNTTGDDYKVEATVREGTKTITVGPTKVESEQFDTEAEAQAYIDNLEAQGYDVSNLKKELIPFEDIIWKDEEGVVVNPGQVDGTTFKYNHFDITLITEFTKIDASGNSTKVTGSIAISSVSINNENVVMEGPSVDPNEGYTEYTSQERNNLNVTNKSLVTITGTVTYYDPTTKTSTTLPFTITGYLSESQNVCGGKGDAKGFDLEFESVTIVNNKVIVDSNLISKYKVEGTITKQEQRIVYYVDTTTTTYGYDYKLDAEGMNITGHSVTGTATKDIYKDVYLLDMNKTTLDYDYRVYAEGIKFIEYTLTGTKSQDIYKDVYLLNINKTILDYNYRAYADGIKLIGYSVTGTATKDIYKDVYLLDMNKTTLDYDYEVSGTGEKTYYDVISKYVKLVDVNYLIEYIELGIGGDVEELPPQTGVNGNISLIKIVIGLIIGLILIIKNIFDKANA